MCMLHRPVRMQPRPRVLYRPSADIKDPGYLSLLRNICQTLVSSNMGQVPLGHLTACHLG